MSPGDMARSQPPGDDAEFIPISPEPDRARPKDRGQTAVLPAFRA
jgi:hypothetical protein